MNNNYQTIENQLRKYSFEFLKVNPEPFNMLETLYKRYPQKIYDAQKPNLLAAAIIYIYLKQNGLNGRGGITAKRVGDYFGVKSSAITQKAFDVEFLLEDKAKHIRTDKPYEFIDIDRFEANELYWDFLESKEADDIKKSIKTLKSIIKKDPDFFDPYISLHEYYIANNEINKAIAIMEDGFNRAVRLIDNEGEFPDELNWGFIENRHIIRMLFNFAMLLWGGGDKDRALAVFMELLKSNPNDNIGARYSIVAMLEGFGSQEEYEEKFETKDGMGLDGIKLEEWFCKVAQKHKDVISWWLDLEA